MTDLRDWYQSTTSRIFFVGYYHIIGPLSYTIEPMFLDVYLALTLYANVMVHVLATTKRRGVDYFDDASFFPHFSVHSPEHATLISEVIGCNDRH